MLGARPPHTQASAAPIVARSRRRLRPSRASGFVHGREADLEGAHRSRVPSGRIVLRNSSLLFPMPVQATEVLWKHSDPHREAENRSMSLESVRAFLAERAPDILVIETAVSSATVELAAQAHGVEPDQIAKTDLHTRR